MQNKLLPLRFKRPRPWIARDHGDQHPASPTKPGQSRRFGFLADGFRQKERTRGGRHFNRERRNDEKSKGDPVSDRPCEVSVRRSYLPGSVGIFASFQPAMPAAMCLTFV